MGRLMRKQAINQGQSTIDAASLVFGHSILDYCVSECCRITACVGQEVWEPRVLGRKIALSEFKDRDFGTVLQEMVLDYVEEQTQRTSLSKRIDLLNQICQPVPPFTFANQPYKYDRARIEEIDTKRQEIVHRVALEGSLEAIEADLEYLEATTAFVVSLVSRKFTLPVDLQVWIEHVQRNLKPE
jgi:hypothetical protein